MSRFYVSVIGTMLIRLLAPFQQCISVIYPNPSPSRRRPFLVGLAGAPGPLSLSSGRVGHSFVGEWGTRGMPGRGSPSRSPGGRSVYFVFLMVAESD
jgi:hypothetical protein